MNYYEIIPATKSFRGKGPLTYSSKRELFIGHIVIIKLRGSNYLALVIKKTNKPDFETVDILDTLENLSIPPAQLKLLIWMASFYPGYLGSTAQLFIPSFLNSFLPNKEQLSPLSPLDISQLPRLTTEQKKAYEAVTSSKDTTFILHGVTGSGKTRLYIEHALNSIKKGRSVIILTPELSLTAPIEKIFRKVFKDRVLVNHHSLTIKQKKALWSTILNSTEPLVVIGPRSSLFLPLERIGLIVVDEFHEPAYKQEAAPYYHANRVASMLSRLNKCLLIFGSATPPINDYYLAKQKNVPILKLSYPALVGHNIKEESVIVDLTKPEEKSPYPLISNTLIKELASVIKRGEQAMLFINKRGSARSIACQDCGHKALCDNCDLPMVYHADQHLIRCHTCGIKKQSPTNCPACGSIRIFFSSPGTKAISQSLAKIFPGIQIARFDRDNKKSERMENSYDNLIKDIDIIVGTQTIAKGHDLPRLSLVAMLLAETGLNFPDFTSEERSYQLIKQLSGRINRGHLKGRFIVQTFSPSSRSIALGLSKSWDRFFLEELDQRKIHGFPPFYSVAKIESSRKSRASAEQSLNKLVSMLSKNFKLDILGPYPAFVEKKSSKWYWQIIIKSANRTELCKAAESIPTSFKVDIDPNNFL